MYYNENDPLNVPQGWQCPICKRVYSPMTPMCFTCGGEQKTTATSIDAQAPEGCRATLMKDKYGNEYTLYSNNINHINEEQ